MKERAIEINASDNKSGINRGGITMAVGKTEFVEMAVDMVLSYRQYQQEPISCIVDGYTKKIIENNYSSVFDQLILLPESFNTGRIRKFSCAELTPYESTLFIDSDILFLKGISGLWEEAELNNSITMIGHYIDKSTNIKHHGFEVSELISHNNISHYLKTNSGFFHFNKSTAKPFFKSCLEKYMELVSKRDLYSKGWLGDEIAIGMVSYKFDVNCFKSPSPMMWDDKLAKLKINNNEYPICHFIAPIPHFTVKGLVRRAKKLRKINRISTGGEKVWIQINDKRLMSQKPTIRLRIKCKINEYIQLFLNEK